MSFELFVAYRYLTGRRKGLFYLITTGIGIAGISLGVAALIITLAVMNGFHTEIQKRILGLQSHVVLTHRSSPLFDGHEKLSARIEKMQGVSAASPFVYGQVILRKEGASTGAVVKGIDYLKERKVSSIDEYLATGNWLDINDNGILLGKILAKTLGARTGDKVMLVSINENASPFAAMTAIPKVVMLPVAGTFDSGMYEYDANMGFISLKKAQKIFGSGDKVSGIGIRVAKPGLAGDISGNISKQLDGNYVASSWQVMNRALFSALKLEKLMMFIVVTLIVLVASFNIVSNLLLFCIEKIKDIGILTALGATRKNIRKIFLFEGIMMGLVGILLGSGLGVLISVLLDKYRVIRLPADVYYLDRLPVRVAIADVTVVVLSAFIIVLVSTFYPAKKAAETDPLEAIRYG